MRRVCVSATQEAKDLKVGLSDAIAYVAMKEDGVSEIYSFDLDFIEGVTRMRR